MQSKNKKNEALQSGFNVFLQSTPKTDDGAQVTNTDTPKTDDGETFSKHNLTFSDDLFEKVKVICSRTGKSQRQVLDAIIRKYVNEYEAKNGELVAESLEL